MGEDAPTELWSTTGRGEHPLAGAGSVAGIDVGGTYTKAVLVGASGRIVERVRANTPRTGGAAVVEHLVALVARLATAAAPDEPLAAVGVGVPGIVDEAAGIARYSANLAWRELALVDALRQRVGVPVALGHDVRLGALGEGTLGAARGVADFLYLPIGTGVAAALVLGGRVRRGVHGAAGEVGHVIIEPGGPLCGCGRHGCLEAVASAGALARRYGERRPGEQLDAAAVLARAVSGDAVADALWREAVHALGVSLAGAQALVDVELVVVGGGLAHAGGPLFAGLADVLADRLGWIAAPRLAAAALRDDAACLGAAVIARDALNARPPAPGGGAP